MAADKVVQIFNKKGKAMSTLNFSVPEDLENAFNTTFGGQNKSAVMAELLREAVVRAQGQQRSIEVWQRILARRQRAPGVTEERFVAPVKKADREGKSSCFPMSPGTEHGAQVWRG